MAAKRPYETNARMLSELKQLHATAKDLHKIWTNAGQVRKGKLLQHRYCFKSRYYKHTMVCVCMGALA